MIKYNYANVKQLVSFLSIVPVHDAHIKKILYDKEEKSLSIILDNKYCNVIIKIIFEDVKIFFSVDSDRWSENDMVSSLTLESDFSQLQFIINQYQICVNNEMYLLFQMFSGNEMHVVCRGVSFEVYELKQ